MEKEIWKDIKEFEGLYQVSNLGRVKTLNNKKSRKEKIRKIHNDQRGYLIVYLSKNGNGKFYKVHRLVAQTFIENPLNKPQVNHKDECKTNNVWTNLEWVTRKENMNYGTRTQRATNKILEHTKKIKQYDLQGNFIKTWNSCHEVEKFFGCPHNSISKCCRGLQNKCCNYIWKYN